MKAQTHRMACASGSASHAAMVTAALLLLSVSNILGASADNNAVVAAADGSSLPAGTYRSILDLNGRQVVVNVSIAGAERPKPTNQTEIQGKPAIPDAAPEAPSKHDTRVSLSTVIVLGVLIVAFIIFEFLRSRRALRPYRQALQLLAQGRYGEAQPLLTSIEGKLPDVKRHWARFYISFCYLQLKDFRSAETILASLHREHPGDQRVSYLLAYLKVAEELYDDAELILDKMKGNNELGFRDTRKLFCIVKLRRADAALQDGRLEAAAELYEAVQQVGEFVDFVPPDFRNREVVLGTKALFDKDVESARAQFEVLRKVGEDPTRADSKMLAAKASLGLALALWIEDDAEGDSALDAALETCVSMLDGADPLELPWPSDSTIAESDKANIRQALDKAELQEPVSAEQRDISRCLRDIHLLRAMAVLRRWRRESGEEAYKTISLQLNAVLRRLAASRERDTLFSDVYLVAGLLKFYLLPPGKARQAAVDLLERARILGVRDPYAMEIINNRDRLAKANADAVDKYQLLLDRYLNDVTVLNEVRHDLLHRLSGNPRFMTRYKLSDLSRAQIAPATVEEMLKRSEVLVSRLAEIVHPEPDSEFRKLADQLQDRSVKLFEDARSLERMQSQLMALASDQVFSD